MNARPQGSAELQVLGVGLRGGRDVAELSLILIFTCTLTCVPGLQWEPESKGLD